MSLCSLLKDFYSSTEVERDQKKPFEVYRRDEAGGKAVQLS